MGKGLAARVGEALEKEKGLIKRSGGNLERFDPKKTFKRSVGLDGTSHRRLATVQEQC